MERAGDFACEKQFQKFNLLLWHTHSLTMTADKADQAGGLQHPRSGVRLSVCAYKCVAGEQWQGNVFAAIAPAVDFFAQRQEGLYAFGNARRLSFQTGTASGPHTTRAHHGCEPEYPELNQQLYLPLCPVRLC